MLSPPRNKIPSVTYNSSIQKAVAIIKDISKPEFCITDNRVEFQRHILL